MEMMLWNVILSFVSGLVLWFIKVMWDELQRVQILLNRTREEIARDNITNDEINRISQHLDQRFNKLEQKIDNLMQRNANA
jgi:CHASE3 domain sensor protein